MKKKTRKKDRNTFIFPLLLLFIFLFFVNIVIAYNEHFGIIAQTCMTQMQMMTDQRCLYSVSGKIYNVSSLNSPHHGHPCGTDVTGALPSSHTQTLAAYLIPNYIADLCPQTMNTPTPTVTPTDTPTPTGTLPVNPSSSPTATPTITPTATPPTNGPSSPPTGTGCNTPNKSGGMEDLFNSNSANQNCNGNSKDNDDKKNTNKKNNDSDNQKQNKQGNGENGNKTQNKPDNKSFLQSAGDDVRNFFSNITKIFSSSSYFSI